MVKSMTRIAAFLLALCVSVFAAEPRRPVVQRALQPVHAEKLFTEIVPARKAQRAIATRHDERRNDGRADRQSLNSGAHCDNSS